MKQAYLIRTITEYGKLMAYCIDNDVSVWRCYWDEREAGDICYDIDWKEKHLQYSNKQFYIKEGYEIVIPIFTFDKYGKVQIAAKRSLNNV